MWLYRRYEVRRISEFFRLVLSDQSLEGTLRVNFSLMQYHNYTLADIEGLIPWERDLYVAMVIEHVEKEKEQMEEQQRR